MGCVAQMAACSHLTDIRRERSFAIDVYNNINRGRKHLGSSDISVSPTSVKAAGLSSFDLCFSGRLVIEYRIFLDVSKSAEQEFRNKYWSSLPCWPWTRFLLAATHMRSRTKYATENGSIASSERIPLVTWLTLISSFKSCVILLSVAIRSVCMTALLTRCLPLSLHTRCAVMTEVMTNKLSVC